MVDHEATEESAEENQGRLDLVTSDSTNESQVSRFEAKTACKHHQRQSRTPKQWPAQSDVVEWQKANDVLSTAELSRVASILREGQRLKGSHQTKSHCQ